MEVLRLAGRQALLLWVAWGRGCREGATFPGRLPPVLGASWLIRLLQPPPLGSTVGHADFFLASMLWLLFLCNNYTIEDFLKKSEILIRLSKLSLLSESLEEGVECVLNQTVLLC